MAKPRMTEKRKRYLEAVKHGYTKSYNNTTLYNINKYLIENNVDIDFIIKQDLTNSVKDKRNTKKKKAYLEALEQGYGIPYDNTNIIKINAYLEQTRVVPVIPIAIDTEQWFDYVNNLREGREFQPFILRLTSSTITGLTREFNFRNIHTFRVWINGINQANYEGGYDKVIEFNNNRDAFKNAVLDVIDIKGGCNKDHSESKLMELWYQSNETMRAEIERKLIKLKNKTIKGTYNTFETYNPISNHNNCGIACISHILRKELSPKEIRKKYGWRSDSKLTPYQLQNIYNDFKNNDRFLVIVDRNTSIVLDHDMYDYILYENDHYRVILSSDSHTEIKSVKRSDMAFDCETRPTDDYIMVGNQKSYLLKDTITSVYYKEYNQNIQHNYIIKTFTTNEKSSVRQFIDFLELEHRRNKHYNIVAYNGSRFDFYFIIANLTQEELLHTKINLRGYSVIGIEIFNHSFRDPNCFLTGSLSKLCKSFKVSTPKLTEFELNGTKITNENLCFYKPELSFNEFMTLKETEPEFWALYVKYCEYDCISLMELWKKFRKETETLIYKMNPNLLRCCSINSARTIGSLAIKILNNLQKYDSFKNFEKYKKFFETDGFFDNEKYEFVCKFKRGGISHCNQPGLHNHSIAGIDITSQYPTAMKYMIVPSNYSKFYNTYHPELYGYYKLKNLKFNENSFKPVSSQNENGTLNWINENINELYIDSELLKYVIENYGLINFEVETALLSKSYTKGENLFGVYVSVLFEEKARQDSIKNTDEYNPALREVIKLFLNSVSGKLVEDPSHYKGLQYSNQDVDKEKGIKSLNGTGVKQDNNDDTNIWVGCGVMVYSYSKRNLFEYIRLLPKDSSDVIHVETDGIYFDSRLLPDFEKNISNYDGSYPINLGGELGNVKIEHISQGESYWLGKKFYYMYDKEDIMKIKGIPINTIDNHGNKIKLIDKSLYEEVYNWRNGDKPITRKFKTLRKQLFGNTQISSHEMERTITPNMKFKYYN